MYILINYDSAFKLVKKENDIYVEEINIKRTFYKPLFVLDCITRYSIYFYDNYKNIYCIGGINFNDIRIVTNTNENKLDVLKIKEEKRLTWDYFEYDKIAFDMLNRC